MGCVPFTGARRPLIDQQAQRLLAGRDAARRRLEIAALSLRLSGLDPPLGDADAGDVGQRHRTMLAGHGQPFEQGEVGACRRR